MANLLSSSFKPCFARFSSFHSINLIKLDRLKVALAGCQACQKPASLNSVLSVRNLNTKSEPDENYKAPDSDISLEQGVRLSRQGCSTASKSFPGRKRVKVRNVLAKDWTLPEGQDTGIKVYNTITRQKEPLILPHGRMATW